MIHIISGIYRKKEIQVLGRTRPPLQRTREWIFNVLLNYIEFQGLVVLDMFAGSGSFGLECLSRGAEKVYFIEYDKNTASELSKTLKDWKLANGKVLRMNAAYLPECQHKPGLIFIDPPFGHDILKLILNRVVKKGWVGADTIIVLRWDHIFEDSRFEVLNSESMGISNIYILKYIAGSDSK